MNKTSWKTLVDWKSLSSSSLIEDEKKLIIKSINKEEIISTGGRKSIVAVCRFANSELPMVLNKTNMRTIENMFGTDKIEDWYGKEIIIYVEKGIKFGKELVSGLRIKQTPKRICDICGKVIDENLYQLSMKKYGKAYCSKECMDEYEQRQ